MKPQGEGMDNVFFAEQREVPKDCGTGFWVVFALSLHVAVAIGLVGGWFLRGCM